MLQGTVYIALELMYPCLVIDRHVRIELPSTILVQCGVTGTPTNLHCVVYSLFEVQSRQSAIDYHQ